MMFYKDQFIQIKQLNAQKAKICHSFICGEMYNEKCIFLIQEPALFKGEICKYLKSYETFGEKNARAVISAHKSLNLWYIPELSSRDLCVCAAKFKGKVTIVVSAYLDILLEPISEGLRELSEKITLEKIPAVMGIDSNGWSSLWSKNENPRGLLIENWLLENNFRLDKYGQQISLIRKL